MSSIRFTKLALAGLFAMLGGAVHAQVLTTGGGTTSTPSSQVSTTNLIAYYNANNLGSAATTLPDIVNGNSAPFCSGSTGTAPTPTVNGLAFTNANATNCVGPLPAALNATMSLVVGMYVTPIGTSVSPGVNNAVPTATVVTSSLAPFYSNVAFVLGSENSENQQANSVFSPEFFNQSAAANVPTAGYHVYGVDFGTWNGSSCTSYDTFYIDGAPIKTGNLVNGCSSGRQTSGNYYIGPSPVWQAAQYPFPGTLYTALFYNANLGVAGHVAAAAQVLAENIARGVVATPSPVNAAVAPLVPIGDSITYGYPNLIPYGQLLSLNNAPTTGVIINAITGITLAATIASEPYRSAPLCSTPGGPAIATVFLGTNDFYYFASDTAQSVFNKLSAEVALLKKAGCRVGVLTMISRCAAGESPACASANGITSDANKDAYDSLIASSARAMGADFIVDVASFPGLGADGAYANPTSPCQSAASTTPAVGGTSACYQGDATHPTQSGQQTIANIYSNVSNRVFGYGRTSPHVLASSTTRYQMLPADGALSLTGAAAQPLTLPDCTGMTGLDFFINNQSSVAASVTSLLAAQPINGVTAAIAIPAASSIDFVATANSYTSSGCRWVY